MEVHSILIQNKSEVLISITLRWMILKLKQKMVAFSILVR